MNTRSIIWCVSRSAAIRAQFVADPSVTEQFVGRLEDQAVSALETEVARREFLDLRGRDPALEGDLDVLAPFVGGIAAVGDTEDGQLAPTQGERIPLQLVAVESPERRSQAGMPDECADDGEPFGIVRMARAESRHLVRRHPQQRAVGRVLLVAPFRRGERTQAQRVTLRRGWLWHGWVWHE